MYHTHDLQDTWTLWAHLPNDKDWGITSYKKICNFNTVEDTLSVIENIPNDIIKKCMLFIMRQDITPIWEDDRNRHGGCFSYKVSDKNIIEIWKNLSYSLVGETLSNDKNILYNINGVTISPKKNFYIVKIWMSSCDYQNPNTIASHIKGINSHGCLFKIHNPEY